MTDNSQPGSLLQARNLSMAFGGLVVFKNISLDIIEHQIVALIGPNSAGKKSLSIASPVFINPLKATLLSRGRPYQDCVPTKSAVPALGAPIKFRVRL